MTFGKLSTIFELLCSVYDVYWPFVKFYMSYFVIRE